MIQLNVAERHSGKESITMSEFLQTVLSWVTTTGIKIVIALVILVAAFALINAVGRKIRNKLEAQGKLDQTLVRTLSQFAIIALKIIVVVALVGYLGIETGGISAVIASLGVCIGLAVNGTLSNLAGGVMLLLVRPFKLGDFVTAQGQSGTVDNIGICFTRILTIDNKAVYLPNSALSTGVIENYSEKDLRRVDLDYSVAGNDPEKVKALLQKVCAEEKQVLKDPAPFARISDYGAGNGVKITLRAWCRSAEYWDTFFNLQEDVQKAFDKEGIVIPFNQLDVHIKQ